MLTNIESEISVSLFSNNHNFLFGTTNSFYGFKRLVPSTEKNSGQKIAGLCARPFETWHKAPLFFHNHDSNSIHVLTSTLEFKGQWKKHPCTWIESALMWRRDRDKHNQSSIKKYKSQCIGKLTWNLRFNFFQLWTQEFSSKIYQRVQDSKTSTFGACYIIKSRPYRQNNGNKEPKRTECWQTLNQKFRYHYFQTIIIFYLEPQIVFMASNDWSRALKKIRAKKIAGLCARPFETWHKGPLFFHNHDSNSIHVLTSTLEFNVQWKKHPCTWIESALMWRRDRDKHNQSFFTITIQIQYMCWHQLWSSRGNEKNTHAPE